MNIKEKNMANLIHIFDSFIKRDDVEFVEKHEGEDTKRLLFRNEDDVLIEFLFETCEGSTFFDLLTITNHQHNYKNAKRPSKKLLYNHEEKTMSVISTAYHKKIFYENDELDIVKLIKIFEEKKKNETNILILSSGEKVIPKEEFEEIKRENEKWV